MFTTRMSQLARYRNGSQAMEEEAVSNDTIDSVHVFRKI
jgi:hypothetical protein